MASNPKPGSGEWYSRLCAGCGHTFAWHIGEGGRRDCFWQTEITCDPPCTCPQFREPEQEE